MDEKYYKLVSWNAVKLVLTAEIFEPFSFFADLVATSSETKIIQLRSGFMNTAQNIATHCDL